ncbi:MAG: helix-turn-helix transcriptional regulator [Roseovarius sp.]
MTVPAQQAKLLEFGQRVRARRKLLRLSIRRLAEDSQISPSYLSAIESGRNPATGRPPEPSIGVVERLSKALGLTGPVFAADDETQGGCCCHGNHVLLYRLDDERRDLIEILQMAFGGEVAQWLCISDPRRAPESREGVIAWQWPFGRFPYPDTFLVPDRICDALETQVKGLAGRVTAADYGLVIADCSAVMRWMINPEAEIDYEERWVERSTDILTRHVGRAPQANVCVYLHRDLEALDGKIDVLGAILSLFETHARTFVVDPSGAVLSGPEAMSAILAESRPSGVSSSAWRTLCGAAARSYAG